MREFAPTVTELGVMNLESVSKARDRRSTMGWTVSNQIVMLSKQTLGTGNSI